METSAYSPGPGGEQIARMEETQQPSGSGATAYDNTQIKLTKAEQKTLKGRMDVAEKYAATEFIPQWEKVQKLLRGEHYKNMTDDDHRVVVNVMGHILETLTHSVAFSQGDVIVKPKDRQGLMNRAAAEKVADYDLKRSHAFEQARRAFKDSRATNFGVLHTYWEFETDARCYYGERPPVEGEPPDPQAVLDAIEQGNDLPQPVPKEKVRKDHFSVCRIDPRHFRVSPESSWMLDEMEYCGYVEYCRLEDVKANPRYKNTRNLKGSTKNLEGFWEADKDENQKNGDVEFPADLKRVKLSHYYEMRRRLRLTFCDEHDQALLVEKWPWVWDRYPFRLVFNEPGEDQFYQVPPLLQVRHLQEEINHFHTQLSIHIRRFVRRYKAREGSLDQKAQKTVRSGVDGSVIFTKDDPNTTLVPMIDAPLSSDVYNYEQKVMQYLSLLSGLDQYELSRAPTKRMTQEEVQQVAGSGGARAKRAAAAFEELLAGIAEDCIAWNQQYAMRTQELPIFSETGEIVSWLGWSKDEIAGAYAFSVSVGSTELKNKAGQLEDMAYLIQTLAPFFAPDPVTGQPQLLAKPFLRKILSLVPEIDDVASIVGPDQAPQPMLPPGGSNFPLPPGESPGGSPMDPMAQLAMQGGGMPPPPGVGPMGIGG